MLRDDTTGAIGALVNLEESARASAAAVKSIPKPSDVAEVITSLKRVQQVMSQIYAELASWHGAVELGVHHAGEDNPADLQNPSWVRAEVALEEASQYSRDAAAALERARIANMSARWFDEIRADEG